MKINKMLFVFVFSLVNFVVYGMGPIPCQSSRNLEDLDKIYEQILQLPEGRLRLMGSQLLSHENIAAGRMNLISCGMAEQNQTITDDQIQRIMALTVTPEALRYQALYYLTTRSFGSSVMQALNQSLRAVSIFNSQKIIAILADNSADQAAAV